MKVICTLEHGDGNVVGRYAVDVRICSCPKRDKAQEEKKHGETTKEAHRLAENLSKANSSLVLNQNPDKKRKISHDVEEMVMVPVAKKDYEMINKMAESMVGKCKLVWNLIPEWFFMNVFSLIF